MNTNNLHHIFSSNETLDILSNHISTWAMSHTVNVQYIDNKLIFSNIPSILVLRCSLISFLYDNNIKWMINNDIREVTSYLISKINVEDEKIYIPIV